MTFLQLYTLTAVTAVLVLSGALIWTALAPYREAKSARREMALDERRAR